MKTSRFVEGLIKRGVDRRIAIYVERIISQRLDEMRINRGFVHDFMHMDIIFRPIGGQNKGDVFANAESKE